MGSGAGLCSGGDEGTPGGTSGCGVSGGVGVRAGGLGFSGRRLRVVRIDLWIWTLHLKHSSRTVTCYGPVRASPSGGRSASYITAKALAIPPDLLAERAAESPA